MWYDDKDDGSYMIFNFGGLDFFGCLSEDKFVMISGVGNLLRNLFFFNYLLEELEEDENVDYG